MAAPEEFLTTEETAQLLRLHDRTIRTLCCAKRLPGAAKLFGKWLIHKPTLITFFKDKEEGNHEGQAAEPGT
jgi:excisionase family DNA binding protein